MLYVAFCTIMAISRQKEARSRDYALLLFRMTSRVLYSAQYHGQHCTPHAFEQSGALHMHSHDNKYPSQPGFEPRSPRLQAPVDTNEPSGPASLLIHSISYVASPGEWNKTILCSDTWWMNMIDYLGVSRVDIDLRRFLANLAGIMSFSCIWKGVSATLHGGRYTLSYPRGRCIPDCIQII